MREQLRQALEDGIVLGVKWGVAAILVIISVSWLLGDYNTVRSRAWSGQQAYDALAAAQAQQPQPVAQSAPAPATEEQP